TSRKAMEEALRSSEARFHAFVSHTPALIFMKDQDGRVLEMNGGLVRLWNRPAGSWIGKTNFDLWPAEYAQQYQETDQIVLTTGKPLEIVEDVPLPDGTARQFLVCKFPFRDGSGKAFLGGVALDITDLKRAEQALRESEQRQA